KASKKKASKKKASKKKASKKKASKKKASKKRSKKKGSAEGLSGSPWDRLVAALEQAREAALELAERDVNRGREAVEKLVGDARDTLANFEDMAEKGIARLTGKGS
ncbi:MAG: hypothetical protein RQ729_11735, partial [Wenzhouxiangellaceae bacterium]|nr:hypothetical protein [Wenzhouxiangellaceae bacterium]